MKTRNGFVSNSSSSSFMVDRSKITYEQDLLIQYACSEDHGIFRGGTLTGWVLESTYGTLVGFTNMDNFDMEEYFEKIEIPKDAVVWANKDVPDNDRKMGWPDYDDENWDKKDKILRMKTYNKAREILEQMKYNSMSETEK